MPHKDNPPTARSWTGRVFVGVSLDGFIARPDGDISWLTDPAPREHADVEATCPALTWETFFPTVDHIVMGRGTYETVAGFDEWPYANKHVVVLSSTLGDDDERVTVCRSLVEVCALLRQRDARQVYLDGGQTIRAFLRAGLVDEITITHVPVLIGEGLPLFGELESDVPLVLVGSHASDGMVHATYRIAN